MTDEECIAILKQETRGVLSLQGDDGYPYGVPMDFWYEETDGHIYFHSSRRGHKIDSIGRCDKVSFTVFDKGFRREGEWAWNVKSVILFGRIRIVEDQDKAVEMIRRFGNKYTEDSAYVEKELKESIHHAYCLELIPEHMTGKLVNES